VVKLHAIVALMIFTEHVEFQMLVIDSATQRVLYHLKVLIAMTLAYSSQILWCYHCHANFVVTSNRMETYFLL
jgi:hypothetical protein